MHLLCPHCQNPIELIDLAAKEEVVCPTCGSNFRLDQGSTTQWAPPDGAKKLGKFELREKVGVGAFGTVYKAWDTELERVVAIKIPRAGNIGDGQDLERFLREARSVAQLRHPSIVPIYEVGQVEGVPFLVSDFVKGVTLEDYLTAHRPTFRESAEIIAAVAHSLHVAHTEGVIHRDVKPTNIMLDEKGRTQLMDFGLAKRDAGEITMTLEGQVLGTPAYMSPEQARGEAHQVDGRGDVYSLGVILYRLLTGELPFRGNTRMLLHQVLQDEPKAPRSLNDKIPRDLQTICQRAMAKEPSRRYATAAGLAEDLERFLRGEPVKARPVSRFEWTWLWARRNPLVASLSGAASFLLLSTLAATSIGYWTASCAKQEADDQRQIAVTSEQQARAAELNEAAARKLADQNLQKAQETLVTSLYHQATALRQSFQPGRRAGALDALKQAAAIRQEPALRTEFIRCLDLPDLAPLPAKSELATLYIRAFRGRGERVIAQGENRTASEYDLASAKRLNEWRLAEAGTNPIAWSPDGRYCVTLNLLAKRTQLWELDTRAPPRDLKDANGHPVLAQRLAFNSRSNLLAIEIHLGGDRFAFFIYKLEGLNLLNSWEIQAQRVDCLKVRPDGKVLAAKVVSGRASVVTLWRVADGKEWASLSSEEAPGNSPNPDRIDFSADGRLLAVAGESAGVTVYALPVDPSREPAGNGSTKPAPQVIANFAAHPRFGYGGTPYVPGGIFMPEQLAAHPGLDYGGGTLALQFSPDGAWLATVGEDGWLRLWEARTGLLVVQSRQGGLKIQRHDLVANRAAGLRWSASGSHLLCSLDRQSALWEFRRPLVREYRTRNANDALIGLLSLAFDPSDRWLACGTKDVVLVDLQNPHLEQVLLEDRYILVRDLAFSPASDRLWKQVLDGGTLWQLPAPVGKPSPATARTRQFDSIAFNPEGQRIACGTELGVGPRAWNLDTGRIVLNLSDKSEESDKLGRLLRKAWLTRDGGYLAGYQMQGTEGLLRVFDLTDGSALCSVKLNAIPRFCALAEQAQLVAVTDAGQVFIYDPRTGKKTSTLVGHEGLITGLAFDGTGRLLATTSLSDGTTRLWNPATGEQLAIFQSGHGAITSVALSPSGRWLAAGDIAGQCRLWDLAEVRQHLKEASLDWHAPPIPVTPRPAPGSAPVFLAEARHEHLMQRYGEAVDAYAKSLALDTNQPVAYRDRGAALFQLRRYAEAVEDFEKAKELAPETPYGESFLKSLQFRGIAYAESGAWDKAKADFLKAIKNGAAKDMTTREKAVLHLAAGDFRGYRKHCDALLLNFMGKEKPATTNPVVWTCVLAPNTFPEYMRIQELAEDGVDTEPKNWLYHNTLGAVLCRAGQHDVAVQRLQKSIQLTGKEGHPRDWLFLAIAFHHLGHAEDARKWLDKAGHWLNENSKDKTSNHASAKPGFNERLELLLLRREAQTLLAESKPAGNK